MTRKDVRSAHVADPDIRAFGGCLDFEQFAFCFGETGHLRFIHKLKPFGSMSTAEQNEVLSRQISLIGTNEAYSIATNWLSALQVDIRQLEKTNRPSVEQRASWTDNRKKLRLLPIFHVNWGPRNDPKVDITIDGRDKALLVLRLEDDSFSCGHTNLIRNPADLVALPDDEFRKMSQQQRDDLVTRYCAFSYTSAAPSKDPYH